MFDCLMKTLPRELMELTHLERKIGVVHQHVDASPLFLNCHNHSSHLVVPRYVRLKDHTSTAVSLNLPKNLLCGFLVLVIVDNDLGAGLRKTLCSGRTNPAAPPGDQNDSSLEPPASGLLGHGFKSSNCNRVFRRALFILRSVVFKGEKLHLHVR